ncbi:MAG: hypothetical protein ACP5EQ_06940 [Candidatus Cloacimonadia bacterium]
MLKKLESVTIITVVAGLATLFSFIGKLSLFAVSRTREYFADARSVEFTRNPAGVASALRKIATISKNCPQPILQQHLFSVHIHLFT